MITWDQAIQDVQDTTNDSSAASLVFLKRRLNQGYKKVLAEFNTQQNERTQFGTTVAAQQYYQVPYDLVAPKSVTVAVGTTIYPLVWVESQSQWDYLNISQNITSSTPSRAFYRPRFGVNGGDIGFWPTPSTAGLPITLVYVATDKDLTAVAYSTGTVAVTVNSNTVTGSGTAWTPQMIGRYFNLTDTTTDGLFYRITGVASPTSLTIEQNYEGTNQGTATYQICEIFALPEEMHLIPEYFALWQYYGLKQNKDLTNQYMNLFREELLIAKNTWGKKVRDNIIKQGPVGYGFPNTYPAYFPGGGIAS